MTSNASKDLTDSVLGENHLRRIMRNYIAYYHRYERRAA
jgi:hypothetical protein